MSLSGTNVITVQLGDAGGIETSGYLSSSPLIKNGVLPGTGNGTTYFYHLLTEASHLVSGITSLYLQNASSNSWVCHYSATLDADENFIGAGSKALSGYIRFWFCQHSIRVIK